MPSKARQDAIRAAMTRRRDPDNTPGQTAVSTRKRRLTVDLAPDLMLAFESYVLRLRHDSRRSISQADVIRAVIEELDKGGEVADAIRAHVLNS